MGIFGNQNTEVNLNGWGEDIDECTFQFTDPTGTYTGNISVYLHAVAASPNNKMVVGIFAVVDNSKVAASAEKTGLVTGWQTANLVGSFALTQNAYYRLVVHSKDENSGRYANGDIAGQHGWTTRGYDGTLPATITPDGTEQKICSIFCSYEAVGGATLEQESFRFRNDDGTEANATWAADQDANMSANAADKRIRIIVNANGDPASSQFQLEWSKVGEDVWRKVQN